MTFEETTLFMIRHGELTNVKQQRFTGQEDVPLTKKGWTQTTSFLKRLSKERISLVLSSDLERTAKPAKYYSDAFNCPLLISKDLREIDAGKWQKRSYSDVMLEDADYLTMRYKDPVKVPFPDGESLKDLKIRVIKCFKRVIKVNSGKNMLLIGHAGVIRVILFHYLKIPLKQFFSFEVDYGSLTVLRFFSDGNVTLKLFNYRDLQC